MAKARVNMAVWFKVHFRSPSDDPSTYIVDWHREITHVMNHMPTEAKVVPPPWSPNMCIALPKGIELCYRLLTQCEEGCRDARKYLSNSGDSVVDYANSELLRRGGYNIKDSPFGNYIYAQTLRCPYNREQLLPDD